MHANGYFFCEILTLLLRLFCQVSKPPTVALGAAKL